ncbi:Glycerophosphodiester phosphodiesterase GDPD6 [Smittium culicis]|uniref:glycerophosphodiester phosphodiesterase n=1 Tax=Smittium culicis TaxID=133412 RepID=A0A1R1YSR3_9FUNG|nr:Glycerophosphodiester phosphodiesterase GDPD6 [Smittium culicis]
MYSKMLLSSSSILFLSLSSVFADSCQWDTLHGNPTKLVAHRGEKAFMPEHSYGSYHMAAFEAIDYIEPDVVVTKDGILVVCHDEWLGTTTNIASIPKFADRKKNILFEGKYTTINRTDYFIHDFTYAELQEVKLVVNKNFPTRPTYFDNDFSIMSFDSYLDKIMNVTQLFNRTYGIIPELKSPEFYNSLFKSANGRWFEDQLLATLEKRGFFANQPGSPDPIMGEGDLLDSILNIKPNNYLKPNYLRAAIQSFDPESCQYLASKTKIPIVALDSETPTWYTPKGLDHIATFSKIFSPWKDLMLAGPQLYFDLTKVAYNKTQIDEMGGFLSPKDLVSECHKRGIELSPYTFYDSRQGSSLICSNPTYNSTTFPFCPKNKKDEFFYFFSIGTDYMFVENVFEAQILRLAYDYNLRLNADF